MDYHISIVLKRVQNEREKSIKNYSKSDLYTGTDMGTLIHWYDRLTEKILLNPPLRLIRELLILENADGEIQEVVYTYSQEEKMEDPEAFGIRVESIR